MIASTVRGPVASPSTPRGTGLSAVLALVLASAGCHPGGGGNGMVCDAPQAQHGTFTLRNCSDHVARKVSCREVPPGQDGGVPSQLCECVVGPNVQRIFTLTTMNSLQGPGFTATVNRSCGWNLQST